MRKKDNLLSQKAIYVKDGKVPAELEADYSVIGKLSQEMIVGILKSELEKIDINASAPAFMRIASVIKDAYFEGERESRLVSLRLNKPLGDYTPPEVFIRHQGSRAVPYIKLFEGSILGEQSPIEAVIIGPHPDRGRREEALSTYLSARGLENIKIFHSEVPYLGG